MDIDLTDFSAAQHGALFTLLILAMFADGHLTTVAEKPLQQLLTAMGHTEELDRQREFDEAVTRLRPSIQTIYTAKEQALALAEFFTIRNQQKQVYQAVEQMMAADNHVSSWETVLLMELRMKFRL
jgi:methionine-rich copper-binding protein CopC